MRSYDSSIQNGGGILDLRSAVDLFAQCRGDFGLCFSADECLAISRAYSESGRRVLPDRWTARQIAEALKGRTPTFDDQERSTYA